MRSRLEARAMWEAAKKAAATHIHAFTLCHPLGPPQITHTHTRIQTHTHGTHTTACLRRQAGPGGLRAAHGAGRGGAARRRADAAQDGAQPPGRAGGRRRRRRRGGGRGGCGCCCCAAGLAGQVRQPEHCGAGPQLLHGAAAGEGERHAGGWGEGRCKDGRGRERGGREGRQPSMWGPEGHPGWAGTYTDTPPPPPPPSAPSAPSAPLRPLLQVLGRLPKLSILMASSNALAGSPLTPELLGGGLSRLQALVLQGNAVAELPPLISRLTELKVRRGAGPRGRGGGGGGGGEGVSCGGGGG